MSKLPTVGQYMDRNVPVLTADVPILEAVDFLLENGVTGAPVVDGVGQLMGILTAFDCLRLIAEGASGDRPKGLVADFMTTDVITAPSRMDIYYAAGLFLGNRFRRLPIVDGGKLVGAITRFDMLRAIKANLS